MEYTNEQFEADCAFIESMDEVIEAHKQAVARVKKYTVNHLRDSLNVGKVKITYRKRSTRSVVNQKILKEMAEEIPVIKKAWETKETAASASVKVEYTAADIGAAVSQAIEDNLS